MASKSTNRTINIWINNEQVENKLRSITSASRKLKNELSGMEIGSKKYIKTVKKIQELEGHIQKHRIGLKDASGQWDKLGNNVQSMTAASKRLKQELAEMEINSKKYIRTIGEIKKIDRHIKKHEARLKETTSAWKRMRKEIKTVAGGNLIANALSGLANGVGQAFQFITKATGEAEQGLTNVLTLLSEKDVVRYSDALKEGSSEITRMGFAQADTNKALFDAVSAGVSAGEATEFLAKAAVLAKGGVTKLGVAVDGMTTIQNAYSLSTSEATEIADAFFSAQKKGKTTVEELANSIGKVAPIAANVGVSYKELLSASARLTLTGISTSESMTQLKAVFSNLMKPGTDAAKVLKKFGIPMGVTQLKAAGFTETLRKLNEVVKESPDLLSRMIPSIEGQNAVLALTNEGFESYSQILKDVGEDIGVNSSLQRAYNKQMETLPNIMAAASGEMTAMAVEVGQKLTPVLKAILPIITGMKKRFVQLASWIAENSKLLGFLAQWLSPAGAMMSFFANSAAKAEKATESFGQEITKSYAELDTMFKSLERTSKGTAAHKVALDQINTTYGKYLPNLLTENSTLREIEAAQLLVNKSLVSNIAIKRKKAETEDIILDRLKKEKSIMEQLKDLAPNKANQSVIIAKFQEAVSVFQSWELAMGSTLDGRRQIFDLQENYIQEQFTKPFGLSKSAVKGLAREMSNLRGSESGSISDINAMYDQYIIKINKAKQTGAANIINPNSPIFGAGRAKKELTLFSKYSSEWDRLNKIIIKQRRKFGLIGLSTQAKELQQVQIHYNDMLLIVDGAIMELEAKQNTKKGLNDKEQDLLRKFNQQSLDLTLLREEKNRQIEEKYANLKIAEKKKLQGKIADVLASDEERELKATADKFKDLISQAEKYGIDTVELFKQMNIELDDIRVKFSTDGEVKDIFGFTDSDYEKVKKNVDKIAEGMNALGNVYSAYSDLRNSREDAILQKYSENTNRRKELLDKQLASGEISERNYKLRIADLDTALETKRRKIEHDRAVRAKTQGIFEATISTATAIASSLPNLILAGLAGTAGLIQIAAIAAEPIPAYAGGGRINKPEYALIGEAGPEIILSNSILRNPTLGPIADDLARIQEGRQPNFINKPAQPNFSSINEAIIPLRGGGVSNNTTINNADSRGLKEVANSMQQVSQGVESLAKTVSELKYLKAIISQSEFNDRDEEQELLAKYSNF